MRKFRLLADDIDRHLQDAQLRPHTMWQFAARTTRLHGSPALLKLVLEELYPDDLFTKLVGDLHRVPLRRWPQGLTIAVALRQCSWRRDGLATIARRSRSSLADQRFTPTPIDAPPGHHDIDSPARLDPVKALRFAPTPSGAHGLDRLSIEPREGICVMAGRA